MSQNRPSFSEIVPRTRTFRGLWRDGDWVFKQYTIIQKGMGEDLNLEETARILARQLLTSVAKTDEHYGIGFLTLHLSEAFHQIVVNWWARENELRHHVFKARPDNKGKFTNITSSGEAFCIWELEVLAHERQAWIRHVLENRGKDGFHNYLADILPTSSGSSEIIV